MCDDQRAELTFALPKASTTATSNTSATQRPNLHRQQRPICSRCPGHSGRQLADQEADIAHENIIRQQWVGCGPRPGKPVRRLSAAIRSLARSSRSVFIWTAGQCCKPTVTLRGALTAADPQRPDDDFKGYGRLSIVKPPFAGYCHCRLVGLCRHSTGCLHQSAMGRKAVR